MVLPILCFFILGVAYGSEPDGSDEMFTIPFTLQPQAKADSRAHRLPRGAVIVNTNLWDKTKPIPYTFDSVLSANQQARSAILEAIANFEANTCLTFKEDPTAPSGLNFTSSSGCDASIGQQDKNSFQAVHLAPASCAIEPIRTMHEMTHALGQDHTQTRSDRDQFVTVYLDKIIPANQHNYQKHNVGEDNNFGTPYDYSSALHYGYSDFHLPTLSGSAARTIDANPQYLTNNMGQRRMYTFNDYRLVNLQYSCADSCSTKITCQNGGYQNPKNCNKCLCTDFFSGDTCATPVNLVQVQDGTPYTLSISVQGSGTLPDPNSLHRPSDWGYKTYLIQAPPGKTLTYTFAALNATGYAPTACSVYCNLSGITVLDKDLTVDGPTYCCIREAVYKTQFPTQMNQLAVRAFYPATGLSLDAQMVFTAN